MDDPRADLSFRQWKFSPPIPPTCNVFSLAECLPSPFPWVPACPAETGITIVLVGGKTSLMVLLPDEAVLLFPSLYCPAQVHSNFSSQGFHDVFLSKGPCLLCGRDVELARDLE